MMHGAVAHYFIRMLWDIDIFQESKSLEIKKLDRGYGAVYRKKWFAWYPVMTSYEFVWLKPVIATKYKQNFDGYIFGITARYFWQYDLTIPEG